MNTTSTRRLPDISSCGLHILAMALMLCDHLWATLLPQYDLLTHIGRIAFPIFAFLLAEGSRRTRHPQQYLLRLTRFALLAEIPFNMMYSGSVIYPYHQNVLWTFLIALMGVFATRAAAEKTRRRWVGVLVGALCILMGFVLGTLAMTDYYGFGVLTVWLFVLFPGTTWRQRLGQAVGLYLINWQWLAGEVLTVTVAGHAVEFPEQGLALLALIPIWLYRGRQGYHSKGFQYVCYAFYPAHMLLLSAIMLLR